MAQRRKSESTEALEVSEGSPLDIAAAKRAEEAEREGISLENPFPVLPVPESGKAEKTLEKPIPVFIRDQRGSFLPGWVVGLICYSGVEGGTGTPSVSVGRRVAQKCPGETLYQVEIREDQFDRPLAQDDVMRGEYRAGQLLKR
jgi:hypothetical protein